MSLQETHAAIADHCAEIARLFNPGARITILVRNPGHGTDHSAALVIGDDDLNLAIDALEYLKNREEKVLRP